MCRDGLAVRRIGFAWRAYGRQTTRSVVSDHFLLTRRSVHSIQIHLQGHDHTQVDNAVRSLVETLKQTAAAFIGPLPLPARNDGDSGLFHQRRIDVTRMGAKTLPRLQELSLPGGVLIDIKT